jgi:diacylglycerol kinase (ATP)
MRAAAIFGLGSKERDLKPFRAIAPAEWMIGLPSDPGGAEAILIFGGDGTIHRHLSQLVRLQLPVLVVPRGSGNDFARALNLRSVRDSLRAWKQFCSRKENLKTIDLGIIRQTDSVPSYFCCVGSVGLDAETARRANHLPTWLRGHGGYALSIPGALAGYAASRIRIALQNDSGEYQTRFDDLAFLVAFANTPAYGGGMKIAPQASMDDGKLDICVIHDIDKLKLFCLFPTVYFGKHLGIPQVEYFQAEHLRIETDQLQEVYADGEYVCQTPIDVSVARRALKIITP